MGATRRDAGGWLLLAFQPLSTAAGYPRYSRRSLSLITCSALINSFVIDYRQRRGRGGDIKIAFDPSLLRREGRRTF